MKISQIDSFVATGFTPGVGLTTLIRSNRGINPLATFTAVATGFTPGVVLSRHSHVIESRGKPARYGQLIYSTRKTENRKLVN